MATYTATTTSSRYMTTSGTCEINSSDLEYENGWPIVRFTGTNTRGLYGYIPPYIYHSAQEKEYVLKHTVNNIIHNYVQTGDLKIRSYGGSYLSDNYPNSTNSSDTPLWSLSENSWVSGYNYDDLSGRLNIDVKTALYNIECVQYPMGYYNKGYTEEQDKKEAIRFKFKQNLAILVPSRGSSVNNLDNPEKRALETFREMVTEKEFRKYLRYGFVLVEGKSGYVYQIFRNNWHTKVWKGGKLIEEICVRIKKDQKCPPTDNVIAFMAAISADEEEFKKLGNVYKMAA